MTASVFLTIFSLAATITGLIVEGLKKIATEANYKNFSANFAAIVVGIIVGVGSCAMYYMNMGIMLNLQNAVTMFLMGCAVALGSMVGYDKIVQLVGQIMKE